jgi:hypothetical protein
MIPSPAISRPREPPPPGRVAPEFVARARALRDLVRRSTDEFEALADRTLRPLRPRPGPGRPAGTSN